MQKSFSRSHGQRWFNQLHRVHGHQSSKFKIIHLQIQDHNERVVLLVETWLFDKEKKANQGSILIF